MKGIKTALRVGFIMAAGLATGAAMDPYPDYKLVYYNYLGGPVVGETIYYCDYSQSTTGLVTGISEEVDLYNCP